MADNVIKTKIWSEEADDSDPFLAKSCYCYGFDVYDELVGTASIAEYLFLLFRGEKPAEDQARLLRDVFVAFAHPGPRDASVQAAMAAGAGGANNAAVLMAALSVGSGLHGGAREVYLCMQILLHCSLKVSEWKSSCNQICEDGLEDVWIKPDHPIGFRPYAKSGSDIINNLVCRLAIVSPGQTLRWLQNNHTELSKESGFPISMALIASAAYLDLGMTPAQGEMFYLLSRLPGAAVHALEQSGQGWRSYPFYEKGLNLID